MPAPIAPSIGGLTHRSIRQLADAEDDDIEELDLDEKQAERHLGEAVLDDDDVDAELSEVEDLDDSLPEVDVVGVDSDDDDNDDIELDESEAGDGD